MKRDFNSWGGSGLSLSRVVCNWCFLRSEHLFRKKPRQQWLLQCRLRKIRDNSACCRRQRARGSSLVRSGVRCLFLAFTDGSPVTVPLAAALGLNYDNEFYLETTTTQYPPPHLLPTCPSSKFILSEIWHENLRFIKFSWECSESKNRKVRTLQDSRQIVRT